MYVCIYICDIPNYFAYRWYRWPHFDPDLLHPAALGYFLVLAGRKRSSCRSRSEFGAALLGLFSPCGAVAATIRVAADPADVGHEFGGHFSGRLGRWTALEDCLTHECWAIFGDHLTNMLGNTLTVWSLSMLKSDESSPLLCSWGFFKATRLLSQTIRWSQKDHLLVFVTAEAFSAGALSVATSFPGVSGSASGLPLGLNSLWFGAIFSFSNMLLGPFRLTFRIVCLKPVEDAFFLMLYWGPGQHIFFVLPRTCADQKGSNPSSPTAKSEHALVILVLAAFLQPDQSMFGIPAVANGWGLLFYLWGSRTGRLCFKREWPAILRFAEAWQKFARATVLLAILLRLGLSSGVQTGQMDE